MADHDPLRMMFDAFELDERNARLTRGGQPVPLPPKAFAVLCAMARRQGQLVTKNDLLDAVWGHQHVSESLLKNVISELRSALGDDAKQPRYIETASRFGYRFIGNIASTATVALTTPNTATRTTAPFIGRDAALATLRACWQRLLAGERQLVWVAGEAGVGKTTLIENFVRELPPKTAAYGRCMEHFGTGEPYLPVLEVLIEICKQEPELPALMRTMAPTWLIQIPGFLTETERASLHAELSGAHPDRMLREMRELMERFAAKRPIVFILEDLHWSDLGTLRMMENYARRQRGAPILWVATFRLTQIVAENHPLRALRQELLLQRLAHEILLDPFSESEVGEYLATRLPSADIPERIIKQLHAHTDGLPLFVANVTDALLARNKGIELDEASSLPVPESLAGVIEGQVARLSPDVQRMLEVASVCGAEFRAGTVADMLNTDAASVREQCDELVRRQLWLKHADIVELPDGDFDSRYAFLHALYQHVLYQRLAAAQRVQHHRRAVRSLQSKRAVGETIAPVILASHYERGHETLAAMGAYAEAASLALKHFAPRDAEELTRHALTLANRSAEGIERMEAELALHAISGTAAAQLHGVASNQARSAYARVQEICDRLPQTPARALTLHGLGWTFYVRGEFEQSIALATRLEDLSKQSEDPVLDVLACNLMGVSCMNQGRLTRGTLYLERGIERCSELGNALRAEFIIDPEVSMRMNVAFPLIDLGYANRGRAHFAAGCERARRIQQPMALMLAHWAGGLLEVRLGNMTAVEQHAQALAEVVERSMVSQGEGPSLWLRGLAEAHAGNPRVGYEHIREGYQRHARYGMYAGCTEVLGYGVQALILAGDFDAAQRDLDEALQLAEQIGERLALPILFSLQARVAKHRGDSERARHALEQALTEARQQEARAHELEVLIELSAHPDHLAALAATYTNFTEGFDSSLYRRAGEVLQASRSSSFPVPGSLHQE